MARETVGSKAAALSALSAAGFPVPAGFVVSDSALEVHAAEPAGAGLADKLRAAAVATGPGPFAVRSSAAAEDRPGASFAGMYESYLNVAPDDLAAAVRRCFASAGADRVRAYQDSVRPDGQSRESGDSGAAGEGGGSRAAMAVLVQQMVDPAAAGVAFTANPLTGARDETVISAVPGLRRKSCVRCGDG
jgi:phosphoenolpyruvate synthase/pyruvate phosphate dikinase